MKLFIQLAIGSLVVFSGIYGIFKNKVYFRSMALEREQGLVFCLFGAALIIYFIRQHKIDKINKQKENALFMCTVCKKIYKKKHLAIQQCSICEGKLVEYKEPINNDTDKPVS